MNHQRNILRVLAIFAALSIMLGAGPSFAGTRLKNICRIKGQEENTLRGLGLVIGLTGTGEANDPLTMRAIARSMEIMGNSLSMNGEQANVDDLRKIKNAVLVMVTATVPATGARRGDLLDCNVAAINGKSLLGGRLAFASLQGPNTQDRRVFALCQGQLTIDNPAQPTVAVVHGGCQMEADVRTKFVRDDGYITLILDKNHANFQTVDAIKQEIERKYLSSLKYGGSSAGDAVASNVRAIDASTIEVRIPEAYIGDHVGFAAELLDTNVFEPEPEARVVVNSRAGSIVISGDVEIGDVIVSHKNVVVQAGGSSAFAAIDADKSSEPKLQELVNQLNALKVPTDDMIEIIRGIEKNGKLHGKLIID
ncbi:MAG: flagellar basal body P-ring protein FlgI [Pirellulales bacterium]